MPTLLEAPTTRPTERGYRLNARTWARPFTARLLEPGIVSYEDKDCGVAYLSKQTLDRCINSFVGRPLIIKHSKTSPQNMKAVGHGYIHEVFYNATDGWWYGKGLADTDEAAKEINEKGFGSVGYKVNQTGRGGEWHCIPFNEEILDFSGEHLAIVGNPRYEEATIKLNSKNKTNTAMSLFKWKKKSDASRENAGDDAAQKAAAAQKLLDDKATADAAAATRENGLSDISGTTELDVPLADGKFETEIVKKVFAPTARSEKAAMIAADGTLDTQAHALIDAIFARAPGVEADLFEQAARHF